VDTFNILNMDYIDDLDQATMDALNKLNDGFSSLEVASDAELSSDIASLIQSSKKQTPSAVSKAPTKSTNMDYLLHLVPPITPAIIASSAILPSQPNIIHGESEDGPAKFVLVPSSSLPTLKAWLSSTQPTFTPTFAPLNRARKALSPESAYPTLGLDTTLPQHRPHSILDGAFRPRHNEYPVYYFFYGTLANLILLASIFNTPPSTEHELRPAHIFGGRLRTWGGKYKALVDSPRERVDGWAFEVATKEEEDALCMYETAKYEVVRVGIEIAGRVVTGCTFRFAGQEEELD
jgi:hypothetical protein